MAQGSHFGRTVLETLAKFRERLDSLTVRVEGSDSTSLTPSRASQMLQPSRHWGERDVDKRLNDYSAILTWPDEESGEDPSVRPTIRVSESTAKTLKSAFKKPLSNTTQLQVRKAYAFPNVEDTRCPKLDCAIKQNLKKDVKDTDSNAARLQIFIIDAVTPLVFILEEAQKGTLTSQSAAEAAKAALLLLGNASAQMTKERRQKVTKDLNKDLMSLAKDPEMFEDAAPLLFGALFEKEMKEHLEPEVSQTVDGPPKLGAEVTSFFSRGPPPASASGWWRQQQRKRQTEISPLPPLKQGKRDTETIPEEGTAWLSRNSLRRDSLRMENITFGACFARIKRVLPFCDNQLMGLGIVPLATELARHSLPLGGRLQHFKSNWVRITQDPWVLEAIQGYRVSFSQQPYQTCPQEL